MGLREPGHLARLLEMNNPVGLRKEKLLHRLQPAMEAEDPYIIGILIALAQQQQRLRDENGAPPPTTGEKVYALFLPEAPAEVMYFYKAVIPRAFLRKLEYPWEAHECPQVTVSYRSVDLTDPAKALGRIERLFYRNHFF